MTNKRKGPLDRQPKMTWNLPATERELDERLDDLRASGMDEAARALLDEWLRVRG